MLSLIGKFHRIGIVEWVDSSSCWTIEVLGTARRGKVCIKAWYLANLWGNKNEFINFFVQIMICKILAKSELLIFFYYFEQKWNTEGFQLNWMELMTTDVAELPKRFAFPVHSILSISSIILLYLCLRLISSLQQITPQNLDVINVYKKCLVFVLPWCSIA